MCFACSLVEDAEQLLSIQICDLFEGVRSARWKTDLASGRAGFWFLPHSQGFPSVCHPKNNLNLFDSGFCKPCASGGFVGADLHHKSACFENLPISSFFGRHCFGGCRKPQH